jgi:NitT/TauT family transport system permease protein
MAAATDTLAAAPATAASRIRTAQLSRSWRVVWPKLLAVAIFVAVWQAVVWTHWKSQVVIPSPFTVFDRVIDDRSTLWDAALITLKRGVVGYIVAIFVGGIIGISVARVKVLRDAIGSMVTGLQTMPSVAWLPLALILFKEGEGAIFFVIVLGAAPSIANGIIDGIDHVPPTLLRAGRVLGARGLSSLRHVVIPAALPSVLSGLKQGWAFAWRSLMAGELIATIPGHQGLGNYIQVSKDFADYTGVYAAMIVIFVIGIIVDAVFFGGAERALRRRYGLVDAATK